MKFLIVVLIIRLVIVLLSRKNEEVENNVAITGNTQDVHPAEYNLR